MASLQVERITAKTRSNYFFRRQYMVSLGIAEYMDNSSTLGKSGGYDDYNELFKPYLKRDILELLCDMAALHKNRPLRILDDGAGYGPFLHEIKLKLVERGITAQTTALSLFVDDELKSRNIDIAYEGPSERLVPAEKQDIIISVKGTLWYLPPSINKEVILKHAYSLVKGGYLLLMTSGVSPNITDPSESQIQKVDTYYKRMRQTLEKRGFDVIHASDAEGCGILIAKRTDAPME